MPTISKNLFWSTLTSVLQLYTGSVVFIVLAKLMSVEDFGILSFGFSLSALAVIVADFGFSLMVMKDYPKVKNDPSAYVSNSILAKTGLALLAGAFFLGYLSLYYSDSWFRVGGLYILFAMISSFCVYLQALLKVQNRFKGAMSSTVVYALAVTLAVIAYWLYEMSLIQLVGCLLLSKTLQLLWTAYLCKGSVGKLAYRPEQISKLVKNSWSFGLHTILGIFYFMVDTQIISLYLGAKEVALYQSVFRIVLILLLVSDIVSGVLLPYLSFKYYKRDNIVEFVSKIFLYLLILGCSLFLGFTSFKNEVLRILYTPEYQEAAVLVFPFSLVIILRTVSSLLGNILTISNRQVYRVLTVGISLAVSLGLNLFLIPVYGILGAAWISVLVHFILFSLYFMYSKLEMPSFVLHTKANLLVVTAAAGIYLLIHYFVGGNPWIILVGLGIWLIVVFSIMKRGNNLHFLQQVLKEKGAG